MQAVLANTLIMSISLGSMNLVRDEPVKGLTLAHQRSGLSLQRAHL